MYRAKRALISTWNVEAWKPKTYHFQSESNWHLWSELRVIMDSRYQHSWLTRTFSPLRSTVVITHQDLLSTKVFLATCTLQKAVALSAANHCCWEPGSCWDKESIKNPTLSSDWKLPPKGARLRGLPIHTARAAKALLVVPLNISSLVTPKRARVAWTW
jgi:hypothetical protein